MIGNFVVHHDFPRHTDGHPITRQIIEYEQRLREVVTNTNSPPLVRVRSIRETVDLGCPGDVVASFTSGKNIDGQLADNGIVTDEEEVRRLRELIDELDIDEAIVHGAFLGFCVKGFATQLNTLGVMREVRIGVALRHDLEDELLGQKGERYLARFMEYGSEVFETGIDELGVPIDPLPDLSLLGPA